MAGKDYIIPLGVDAANVVNPMNEVIETMEKTEAISRETGKALQDSFNKAKKPIKEVDDALKPLNKDLTAVIDLGKKAGKELADAFNAKNADPAKLEKALGGFLGKLGGMTAKIDIQVDDAKLAVFEKQLSNTQSELGQLEVALAMAKEALNSLDPDSQDFKDLSDVILYTESALGEFGNEIDTTTNKQKTLKSELRGIKNELAAMEAAGEAGSQKFRELSQRAGELEDQIGDTNAQIKILASDTAKFDALIEGVSGIAGGFAVAQGAMALFGTENEEIEKALLKVNAAMAILQGLQQVSNTLNKDSAFSVIFLRGARLGDAAAAQVQAVANVSLTAAMGGATVAAGVLRVALSAIGIGLIIAAVAYLIEYWDDLVDAFKKFLPAGTSVSNWFDTAKAAVLGVGKAVVEFLIMPFKVLISLLQGDVAGALEDFVNGMDVVKNTVEGYNDATKRIAAQHALDQKEIRMGQWKNQIEIAEAEGKDVYTTQVKWYENQIALMKKQKKDTADIEQEFLVFMAKKRGDDTKEAAASAKKAADEAERLRKENAKKAEAEAKRQAEMARKFAQDAVDIKLSTMEDGLEKELALIRNNAKKQLKEIQLQGASTVAAKKAEAELISAINAETAKLERETKQKYAKERLELQLDYLKIMQEYSINSKEKDLEIEDLAHIERMQMIESNYKDDEILRKKLMDKEAEFTKQNRKKIAMDWEKNSIDDETERQILLIETMTGFIGNAEDVEKMKQLAILQARAEGAANYLSKLQELGEDENSIVYLNALKSAQATQKAYDDAAGEMGGKKFDLFDSLFGEMDDDKKKFAIETAENFLKDLSGIMDGIVEQYQRQIDKKQEAIDQYNTEIDDLEDQLDTEKELKENGLANNVETIEKEIQAKKAARDEEIRQQEELQKKQLAIQKAQMAAEAAMQLVGMISASVNIFEKSTEFFGPWGIPIAIAAIGAMFGAFAFAKVKAAQSINDGQKFRDGGWIDGASHEDGGVKYYSPDGTSVRELEGGEFVLKKKAARKFGKLAEAMNADDFSKLTTRDIISMGLLEGLFMGLDSSELFSDIEKSNIQSKEVNTFALTIEGGGEMKQINKNLQFLVDAKRNEVEKWEDDYFYYTKIGTRTTKIPKK